MTATILSKIWFHKESKTFYLLPDDVEFLAGNYPIIRFDDAGKMVNKESLGRYEITKVETEALLDEHYEATKKAVAKSVTANTKFKMLFLDEEKQSNSSKPFEPNSILGESSEWMKEFTAAMQNTEATEEENKEAFKKVFSQVPDMFKIFDEKSLDNAAKNPEAWAKEMQEKMFGKAEAKRKEQQKEQRQNEINDQIRKNVEDAMKKHTGDSK